MAAISLDPRVYHQLGRNHPQHSVVVEEIEGLIRVYKDGHVERPQIVPNVPSALPTESNVTSKDIIVDKYTNLWARLYVPNRPTGKRGLLVYFHGGGFCVGSASWSCYHMFLANLASKAGCIIISVNYRLAPENRLPAAYDDGIKTFTWVKQHVQFGSNEQNWWSSRVNVSNMFLAGDSAGANIAHQVAARIGQNGLKGVILIQPFFGGESRTVSEKHADQRFNSALTLSASDTYWRLALPIGANRDHPWCNPLAKSATKLRDLALPRTMICVSELDILRDRSLEFCTAMVNAGKRVDKVIYKGVGHAFQILDYSTLSRVRTEEMLSNLKDFINQ